MSSDSARKDAKIERDPSQLIPPRIDTRLSYKGYAASEGVVLLPGAFIAFLGVMAYLVGASGAALIGLGALTMLGGVVLIFSTSGEYSSSRDLARGGLSFARLQQKLPLSEDDTADDPIHNTRRIDADGIAETTRGTFIGLVRPEGRNTDQLTESQANSLVGQLSDGIDHDIRDWDWKYWSTTHDVDPGEIAERYSEQAESDKLLGDEWVPARELLYDVSDWYVNQNAANWGTGEWSHYFVVEVGPEDISSISRQDKTKSRGERILDSILGRGSQSQDAKKKRMKQQLSKRLKTIRSDVLGSMSIRGEIVGPEEHALLLSEYYAGVSQNFDNIDVENDVKASVWPGRNEMSDDGRSEPSQRPAAIDDDPSISPATEQPGAVGVPSTSFGNDPGSGGDPSVDAGSPVRSPGSGTTDATEAFDDEEKAQHASIMARVRDGLLGDYWPSSEQSTGETEKLKQQREQAESDREQIQQALANDDIEQSEGENALSEIEDEISEIDQKLADDAAEVDTTRGQGQDSLINETPIQDILSTEYDTNNGVGMVGEQLTKTYWVAELPQNPDSLFLRDLYSLKNLDLDVTVHADARDKDMTINYLESELAQIDAEVLDREDEGSDMSSVAASNDSGAYTEMWRILRNQNTEPWRVSMYITVRVGTRRALDFIEEGVEEGAVNENDIDFDYQQRRALEEDCDTLINAVSSTPAKLVASTSSTRQKALFESCGPDSDDVYDQVSVRNRKRLTMGGTLGAMMPFGSATMKEEEGIEQGRSLQNGSSIIADPFNRGGAPHQLTIAKSGSGKTYSVGKRALRWYLADPDRTLILCDTMGGFAGLTEVCNGEHIVVDGSQTINPLAITQTNNETDVGDIDTFRMKIDELTQFIAGILRSQGTQPGDYIPIIEDIARETYADAGISSDPETHSNPSPTMSDFIDKGIEMLDQDADDRDDAFSHEKISARQSDYITDLMTKMTGFRDGGKYQHLDGATESQIQPGEVTYLDLQQIEGSASAEKSTMLHLMLGQVYQAVKRAPAKSMFVIDEAHYLLHSEEMVNWLQRAARHWRHYNASMWFVSQSPQDFAPKSSEEGEGRETITGQCSTVEFFRTPELKDDIGKRFGLNAHQRDFVRENAVSGSAGRGFSQGLISFSDVPGWMRMQVSASLIEDAVLTYDPREDGAFGPYFEEQTGIAAPDTGAHQDGDRNATPEVDLNLDGEIGAGPSGENKASADGGKTEQPPTDQQPEQSQATADSNGESTAPAAADQSPSDSSESSASSNESGQSVQANGNIGGNTGSYNPEASIRELDHMTDEQARSLEMRNMGEVGDLMSNDPEAIAAAGGVSVGEVSSFMQEIANGPVESATDGGKEPDSSVGGSDPMNSGPGVGPQQSPENDPDESPPAPQDGTAPERSSDY